MHRLKMMLQVVGTFSTIDNYHSDNFYQFELLSCFQLHLVPFSSINTTTPMQAWAGPRPKDQTQPQPFQAWLGHTPGAELSSTCPTCTKHQYFAMFREGSPSSQTIVCSMMFDPIKFKIPKHTQ